MAFRNSSAHMLFVSKLRSLEVVIFSVFQFLISHAAVVPVDCILCRAPAEMK